MMAQMMRFVTGMIGIMCLFFFAFTFFNDANLATGDIYENEFSSFDKIQEYGSYLQNQTDDMQEKITTSTTSPTDANTAAQMLNLITQGASISITGLIGFIDVGISLLYDSMGYLGIPAFYVTMAIVMLVFGLLAAIYHAIRGGEL